MSTDRILTLVDGDANVFLTGPGGTGKSYMIHYIYRHCTQKGKRVYVTALTGIAALNLATGHALIDEESGETTTTDFVHHPSTIHKWAGILLGKEDADVLIARVRTYKTTVQRWRETDILVIDEVSMMPADLLEKLNTIGKAIRNSSEPFGGIQLILSGDFLQLPPVSGTWPFLSPVWEELNLVEVVLEEPQRYPDIPYFEMLLRIRKGESITSDIVFLESRHQAFLSEFSEADEPTDELRVKPTNLYSRRVDVSAHNDAQLEQLEGESTVYVAQDTFLPLRGGARAAPYFEMLNEQIPESIALKPGAQVMLKMNIDISMGLANGSRGVVMRTYPDRVTVKFYNGKIVTLGYEAWEVKDKYGVAARAQIPLILAWAITIHKAQGLSLDCAICELSSRVFADGQAYVALSRVRTGGGLYLSAFEPRVLHANEAALKYYEELERLAH